MSGDNELDNLLRSHFAGELDPMRGQARRAFEREVTRPMQRRLRLNAWRAAGGRVAGRIRPYASITLAVAAAAAAGFFLPRAITPPPPGVPMETVAEADTAAPTSADFERTRRPGTVGPGSESPRNAMESARYVDPGTHARTEYYIFPAEQDVTYPSARQ